ncbi:hypothetical protein JVT61DRAFT_2082 [Boletus reticuloceps]|uniref:Uncharacterized protein n=1 Tax=Boletus reticuloceps TaxID=495285 RepID=A0A8I2YQ97_9AGAM|nr:hypothetical protein JVT61DRAFT_2082 [Boletus reticuloceps]
MTGYIGKAVARIFECVAVLSCLCGCSIYTMGSSKIQVNVSQGIATITLNEPRRLNALSAEGWLTLM